MGSGVSQNQAQFNKTALKNSSGSGVGVWRLSTSQRTTTSQGLWKQHRSIAGKTLMPSLSNSC
eukprot:5580915-Amphidinium_carterae.1